MCEDKNLPEPLRGARSGRVERETSCDEGSLTGNIVTKHIAAEMSCTDPINANSGKHCQGTKR